MLRKRASSCSVVGAGAEDLGKGFGADIQLILVVDSIGANFATSSVSNTTQREQQCSRNCGYKFI